MSEQQSIKDTLDVIRKALEDDESSLEEIKDNVLILNKLVKEDGTIDVIEDNSLTKSEIKEILEDMGLHLGMKVDEEDLKQISLAQKKKEIDTEVEL